jgi:hypothetical protein
MLGRSTIAAVLAVVISLLAACDRYVCRYKGREYQVGDTWNDGCLSCRCPAEGAKSLWCSSTACPDSGTDGATDTEVAAAASDR